MSEYKKELLKSAFVAIMAASLLGAVVYNLFQAEHDLMPVTFALDEGRRFVGNYSILEGSCLALELTFLNGSVISSPSSLEEADQVRPILDEYSGEFDAPKLEKIKLSVFDFDDFFYNRNTVLRYLVTWLRDRIVNVKLVDHDQKITELGTSKSLGRKWNMQSGRIGDPKQEHYSLLLDALKASFNVTIREFSSTGYWKATDYVWEITVDELGKMLHGSGMAEIVFTVDINTELKYRLIRTQEEDVTGNTTLSWAGTWGILKLTYEEGEISSVKYKFRSVKLVMLPTGY